MVELELNKEELKIDNIQCIKQKEKQKKSVIQYSKNGLPRIISDRAGQLCNQYFKDKDGE